MSKTFYYSNKFFHAGPDQNPEGGSISSRIFRKSLLPGSGSEIFAGKLAIWQPCSQMSTIQVAKRTFALVAAGTRTLLSHLETAKRTKFLCFFFSFLVFYYHKELHISYLEIFK